MRGIRHIFIVAAFAGIIAQAQTATPPSPLPAECRKWINEDVPYIITDRERRALKQLKTRGECEAFIEQFWLRRDPTPGTPRNEFKEEHYRRIKFANDHFTPPSGLDGWKTDRGHIYIAYGPPDEIDAHPAGDPDGSRPPYETWLYSHIPGIGSNVRIEFVDPGRTGTYLMNLDQHRMIELTGDKYVADFVSTEPGPQVTVGLRQDRTLRIKIPLEGTEFTDSIRITTTAGILVEAQGFTCTFQMLGCLVTPMHELNLEPLDRGTYTLTAEVIDSPSRNVHTYTVPFTVK